MNDALFLFQMFLNHSSDKKKQVVCQKIAKNCLPIVPELENFENKLLLMIKNIQFRNGKNSFQSQLNEHINQIKRDSNIFITNLATFIKWRVKLMKSYYMKTSQRLTRKRTRIK